MHGTKSGEPAKALGEGSGRVSNEGEKQKRREQDDPAETPPGSL